MCLSISIRHTGYLWIFKQDKPISISGSLYLLFTLPGMLFSKIFAWLALGLSINVSFTTRSFLNIPDYFHSSAVKPNATELCAMIDMFYIYTNTVAMGHLWLLSTWNVTGVTEELTF